MIKIIVKNEAVFIKQKVFHCMGDGKDYRVLNYLKNGEIFKTEIVPLIKLKEDKL